jgi:pimeloyl-ACP methyl ester carboxylesterase
MRDMTVELADGRIVAVASHGDETGLPVLFLHGSPASRLGLDFTDEPARERHVHVLGLERPGFGRSDPHVLASVASYAEEVAAVADGLGLSRFGVIGWSGGGPFALACGALLPDRVTAVVTMAGLAHLATPEVRDSLQNDEARVLRYIEEGNVRAAAREFRKRKAVLRLLPGLVVALGRRQVDASDRRLFDRSFVKLMAEGYAQGTAPAINEYRILQAPWGFDLGDIGVPVHIWHGEQDRIVLPVHAHTLAAKIPQAQLHLVPHTGHLAITTHFGDALDSLGIAQPSSFEQ